MRIANGSHHRIDAFEGPLSRVVLDVNHIRREQGTLRSTHDCLVVTRPKAIDQQRDLRTQLLLKHMEVCLVCPTDCHLMPCASKRRGNLSTPT